jgi:hypothetical protein
MPPLQETTRSRNIPIFLFFSVNIATRSASIERIRFISPLPVASGTSNDLRYFQQDGEALSKPYHISRRREKGPVITLPKHHSQPSPVLPFCFTPIPNPYQEYPLRPCPHLLETPQTDTHITHTDTGQNDKPENYTAYTHQQQNH